MKLISGGQTGVDRAVLDVALSAASPMAAGVPRAAGPRIFRSLRACWRDIRILGETPLADPAQRTEWNVRDADACMIVVDAGGVDVSAGTTLAQDLAHRYRKPVIVANLGKPDMLKPPALWLRVQQARHGAGLKLAIGGPRESEAPGIYARAATFIRSLTD